MKLLIIDIYGQSKIVDAQVLPHKGDKVFWDRKPYPEVNDVIMWTNAETIKAAGASGLDIEAIILVS